MLAMTIGAVRRIAHAGLQGCAMHTFVELSGDLFVALSAGSYNIPVADSRFGLPCRQNAVTPVAVGAGCGVLALQDSAAVHALQILLDRMKDGNLVPRQESRIGVTLGANGRLIPLRNHGGRFAGCLNPVHRPVTRQARRRIWISRPSSAPVNALRKFLRFRRVAFRALPRLKFRRSGHFMDIAMTGGTSRFAQNRVDALRSVRCLFRVAGLTLHLWNLRRMGKVFDERVAVPAAQNPVRARCVFLLADGNVFPFLGFHVRLAMTGETSFILLEGLGRFFLTAACRGQTGKYEEEKQARRDYSHR
jgi:hypothetical protein